MAIKVRRLIVAAGGIAMLLSLMADIGYSALDATTRVSVSSSGTEANDISTVPEISADGRYVAFDSDASNLVAGDTNGVGDSFVHDRQTGTTTRVSVAGDGAQANDISGVPSISADGRYVSFFSNASNLVAGDTNGNGDVLVRDRQAGTTTRVSVASDGTQANGDSGFPSISADGRFVAFSSDASNLVAGDTNGVTDVFLRDRQAGTTTRVSVASDGTQANGGPRNRVHISADGRYVAFASGATNLVAGDTNLKEDIFVHDRQTGTTTRVSVASDGAQANGLSDSPSISADGRFVAFESFAGNLVAGDTNGNGDVFVHDRQTGTTTRVSVSNSGAQVSGGGRQPRISADGRYVTFFSSAGSLVAGDTNLTQDVFVRDRQAGTTTRVSVASDGTQANSFSGGQISSISADGRFVAFLSNASNLVAGDTNGVLDIFVRDRQAPTDTTPPLIAVAISPSPNAAGWHTTDVTISWTVSDPESGIATSSGCATATITGETADATRTCTATNGAGLTASLAVTVRIDRTAPAISGARTPPANAHGWSNGDVLVSFTCQDPLSGVASCQAPATVTSEGANQSVTGTAVDRAGNTAQTTVGGISIDRTRPTLTGAATTPPNADGWYKGDVVVAWACSDLLSGIDGGCPASTTVTGQGTALTASATVSDRAGNTTQATVGGIKIDRSPPATTATAPSGWSSDSVTIGLAATDNLSGVTATSYSLDGGPIQTGASAIIEGDGVHTLQFWSEDRAGNVEAPNSVEVRIDNSAPTITFAQSPAANAAGWNNTDVTVTFTCADGLSGIVSCTAPQTVTTEGAQQPVAGTAVNGAGNSATVTAKVSLDKTAPTVGAAATTPPNPSGWYNAPVTVHFTCGDALSGVASCPADITLALDGANQAITRMAYDAAGNSAAATVGGISIDRAAPTISYSGNAGTYTANQVVSITCAATDALSGVASSTCQNVSGPAYTFALGSNTFAATATDRAGNVGTGSASFTVQVNPSGVNALIDQFVTDPQVVAQLREHVNLVMTAPTPQAKAGRVGALENVIKKEIGKSLTQEQADALIRLARAL